MVGGLGELILARRRQLGLSQQELARRLGVSPSTLAQLERTQRRWSTRLLPALAATLAVPQLEVAIAAGIITDLPPLPPRDPTESATAGPTGDWGDEWHRLRAAIDGHRRPVGIEGELTSDDADFLAAVAYLLVERHRDAGDWPSPATGRPSPPTPLPIRGRREDS